jgi:hypothetical protein
MKPLVCCPSGKVGYSNRAGAEVMRDYLRSLGREINDTYRCSRCGNWHLTKMAQATPWAMTTRARCGQWLRRLRAA